MREKTKIGTSVVLLSILVASFFATLPLAIVFANPTAELRAPTMVNPLKDVGDTISVDILVDDVADLWSVDFTLSFDTAILTPVSYFFVTPPPGGFVRTEIADLNDAGGYVHLIGTRALSGGSASDYLGTGDGATTTYSLSNGVIEPGSESAFYGVFNEFLGVAQDPYGWGRDDGPWTGGGGDGIVDTMPVIPSPYPGIEMVYDDGNPYLSYGDPLDPRWVVNYATGEVYSPIVYPYISRWPATGSVMTIDYATTAGVPAIASMDYAPSGGTGSVTFAAAPTAGEEVYLDYSYRDGLTTDVIIPVASITFEVDSRGLSPLSLTSSELLDVYMPANPITHTPVDGSFDNRLQATMSVSGSSPTIIDTGKLPGHVLDVFVEIGPWVDVDVDKLWGFQFVMDFDPNMLLAIDFEITAKNDLGYPFFGGGEFGPDYVALSANSFFGDEVGLSTSEPVHVARISFVVLDLGVTLLSLRDTGMADVNANEMFHETVSGSFANTMDIAVSLTTIFVESRKWSASTDGSSFTLTAQVKSLDVGGMTKTRAHFKVYDSLHIKVADETTAEVNIWQATTIRLDSQLDVGPLDKPASYVVEGTVEYLSPQGAWVTGQKGSPQGSRTTMVKSFTLYP